MYGEKLDSQWTSPSERGRVRLVGVKMRKYLMDRRCVWQVEMRGADGEL